MGSEAGEVGKKGRSPSEENHCPPTHESRHEKADVHSYEETVGGGEEGWRSILIEP
jgi:hypothetical protein